MKQKLGLCCVLAHSPRILLLDEPTSGVDPLSRRELWRILYQLVQEGVTILLSTAYLDEAERCSRIGLLHRGRLLGSGVPSHLRGLARGVIFELELSDPRRATRVLRGQPLVISADLIGGHVHAVTASAEAAPLLAEALTGHGIRVGEIRRIEPSLEDVFVSVIKTRESGSDSVP